MWAVNCVWSGLVSLCNGHHENFARHGATTISCANRPPCVKLRVAVMHWCQVDCGVCTTRGPTAFVLSRQNKTNVRCSPRHAECDTDRDRTVAEYSRICTENFVRINEQTLPMFYARTYFADTGSASSCQFCPYVLCSTLSFQLAIGAHVFFQNYFFGFVDIMVSVVDDYRSVFMLTPSLTVYPYT